MLRQADLEAVLQKASETFPQIRWMGVLLDDGYDGAALNGTLNGLTAKETFGGGTERTSMEAIAAVVEQLRELWS